MPPYLIAFAVAWIAFAVLGLYVAGEKGRSSAEALVLSALFGPFGVLVVALLPAVEPAEEDDPDEYGRAYYRERALADMAAEPAPDAMHPDVDAFLDEMAEAKRKGRRRNTTQDFRE